MSALHAIFCYFTPPAITGMPKEITKAKIACLDFSLQKAKMHLGVSVVIDDPEKLEAIRKRYNESIKCMDKMQKQSL